MVTLAIDPPPSKTIDIEPKRSGRGRLFGYFLVLLVGLSVGFLVGRKTAPRLVPPTPAVMAAPLPQPPGAVQTPMVAQPGSTPALAPAPVGPGEGTPTPQPPPGATQGTPGASAPTPVTPQGPLVRRISASLQGPLEESITAALSAADRPWGEQLTQVVNRLLIWSMRVQRDARKGDTLEVLFELPSPSPTDVASLGDAGPASKEPIVLALRFASQKLGKQITAYRFKPEGETFARYYTREGVEVEQRLMDSPIDDYEQVTSLLRDGRKHKGIDFKTPVGTPVRSPFNGTIARRNWNFSSNGNCLAVVDSKTKRKAIFLHLDTVPREMVVGRKVKKGEVIAQSGNSGRSTAPHLHYQLETADGKVLDPYSVLPTRRASLQGPAKLAFDAELQRLDPLLASR